MDGVNRTSSRESVNNSPNLSQSTNPNPQPSNPSDTTVYTGRELQNQYKAEFRSLTTPFAKFMLKIFACFNLNPKIFIKTPKPIAIESRIKLCHREITSKQSLIKDARDELIECAKSEIKNLRTQLEFLKLPAEAYQKINDQIIQLEELINTLSSHDMFMFSQGSWLLNGKSPMSLTSANSLVFSDTGIKTLQQTAQKIQELKNSINQIDVDKDNGNRYKKSMTKPLEALEEMCTMISNSNFGRCAKKPEDLKFDELCQSNVTLLSNILHTIIEEGNNTSKPSETSAKNQKNRDLLAKLKTEYQKLPDDDTESQKSEGSFESGYQNKSTAKKKKLEVKLYQLTKQLSSIIRERTVAEDTKKEIIQLCKDVLEELDKICTPMIKYEQDKNRAQNPDSPVRSEIQDMQNVCKRNLDIMCNLLQTRQS